MFDYIYADFVLFLNVHFATLTLQNELLVIFDQQKVGFILIFVAKIEKKAKSRAQPALWLDEKGKQYYARVQYGKIVVQRRPKCDKPPTEAQKRAREAFAKNYAGKH